MDVNILLYITIALVAYAVISLLLFHHKANYEERRKKREAKKLEKLKWKYKTININNPLLKKITQSRFIVIKGLWGAGKSILMNVIAHYLYESKNTYDKRNKRYYQHMNNQYLEENTQLEKDKLLPVYSNLDFVEYKTRYKSQDILPYITLQKRAVQKPVYCIDEIASLFPKEMYYEQVANPNPMLEEMKELFKKFRHYTNGWILGTEQDGVDIYVGFRKNGYALVTALGTTVKLSNTGKIIRKIKNFFNIILPPIFTINVSELYQKQLFQEDQRMFWIKILLPLYYSYPVEYYRRKQEINNTIKLKYQEYQTKLSFEGAEWYINYTNKDIFQYDTRAYKNEYADKFDKFGNRKVMQNG